jgi:hypothetical protein
MILVRDVFRLRFGKAKEAKALWKEGAQIESKLGHEPSRCMVDLTGQYYTFVMESTYQDLASFEQDMKKAMSSPEFSAWYQRFVPLVESGHREIFTLLD